MLDLQPPKFIDSEFFVDEPRNWRLKPGAPDEVVREFKIYRFRISKNCLILIH
jgi:hypothetical protein